MASVYQVPLGWRAADDRASGGGQGVVLRVVNESSGAHGALKRLHPERSYSRERRERIAREIRTLEDVAGEGLPRILEHNLDTAGPESELYFITEWVAGPTLQEFAGDRPRPLRESVEVCRLLTGIVQRCHDRNVFHRDIKPDNVILRDSAWPVLVDFGTAWMAPDRAESFKTAAGQELGNRFLRLPELSAGGVKTDPRSDVTFLVGILFFLLTGVAPRVLMDGDGRPPHRALAHRLPDSVTGDAAWPRIESIFDVGFRVALNLRFQDAASLLAYLDGALIPEVGGDDERAIEAALRSYHDVRRQIDEEIDAVEESLGESLEIMRLALNALSTKHGFALIPGRPTSVEPGTKAHLQWVFHRNGADQPRIFLFVYARLDESRSRIIAGYDQMYGASASSRIVYEGLAGDTRALREAMSRAAPGVFSDAVKLLTEEIERSRS